MCAFISYSASWSQRITILSWYLRGMWDLFPVFTFRRCQAATRPGCTTNYTVVPGNVILDLVYYVGLEAGACLRLAGQTRDDFEYGNRKSGRRFCQTHVLRSPKVLKVVSKRTFAVPWPVCHSVSRTRVRALLPILSTLPRSRTSPAPPQVRLKTSPT